MNEQLNHDGIRLEFGDAEDGFAIRRIGDGEERETTFLNVPEDGATFWTLTFWRGNGKNTDGETVSVDNLTACRGRRMERNADGGATFIWEGMDLGEEKGAVTVRATVRFESQGTSKWSLEVSNQSTQYGLAETQYPILRRVAMSGEADVLLPRPDLGARLVKERAWTERDVRFGCLGYCPMMTSFFKGGTGLYVAAHDSRGRIKTLVVGKEQDVSFTTTMENAGLPGKAAEGPRYEVTVAIVKGDWWAAAAAYRQWALTAPWTAKGRLMDRSDYPRRMAEIPLWLNTHAYPQEVTETMAKARELFPQSKVGIHWHLWQHSGHDVNYPEYFPEQPGTKECLNACAAIDCEAMPYVNGRLWSRNLVSFPLISKFALTKADGTPYVERYGTLTPPMSPMCPYTTEWDGVLNDICGRVLELGAKSIFIDQIGACGGIPCYHADHGHPLGGGTWYFDGYQALLAKIHEKYSSQGAFITTEGSSEYWMNVIDGYLQVTQRQPDDVPFFHAVYSGYTTYFCSPENQDDDFISFRAAQTRELLWGQALGWYHPLILQQADKCGLLRRLAEFRQEHEDCLAFGELLGEVKMLDSVPEVKLTWLGRKAFFMWKVKDAPLSPTIHGTMPSVFGYVWRSATNGKTVAFVANVGETERTVRVSWDGQERTLTLAAGDIAVLE